MFDLIKSGKEYKEEALNLSDEIKIPIKGEFLYNYDKIRISQQKAKEKPSNEVEDHTANFYSLVYVYGGDAHVYIDGEKSEVPENSLVIADRFSTIVPCQAGKRKAFRIAVDFKPELFGRVGKGKNDFNDMLKYVIGTFDEYNFKMPKGYFLRDKTGRIRYLVENSFNEYRERKIKYIDIIRDNIRAILIEVARDLGCFTDKSLESELLQRIVDYCQIHYMEKITIQSLSEKFNYSESYITKQCKKELGIPFAEFLRQKRIYSAAMQISEKNKKISDIAKDVGYADVAYFRECFKKYIGMSPTEYRIQVKKSKEWFIGMENLKRQKDNFVHNE